MKIYTRRGDAGQTDLYGGQRVSKDSRRVEAYGTVDELNCALGKVLSMELPEAISSVLITIQGWLFRLGADLANPKIQAQNVFLGDAQIEQLEKWIDEFQEELPPLRSFILPGGVPAAAELHWVRSLCRRAERRAMTLSASETISPAALPFMNRLGDLLFVLARWVNHQAGAGEVPWKP